MGVEPTRASRTFPASCLIALISNVEGSDSPAKGIGSGIKMVQYFINRASKNL